jgi:dolichol-phosphate mannosyltransferase
MNNLTIVIPVYNEGKNIAQAISRIEDEVKSEHLINVIYDFDEDTSIPVVEEEITKYKTPINLIKNKYGRGVLNAIKTGLETAETEYVIVTMADLSDPPAVMNKMLDIALEKNADIVCGSRYMKGGKQIGGPFIKGLMSKYAGLSLYYLAKFPTHDATNSFKLYRISFLKQQKIESTGGFELGMELVVKAHLQGFKVLETPTVWTDRQTGKSNFQIIEWLPSYLKWYFMAFKKLK